jgi:hypothetical protein
VRATGFGKQIYLQYQLEQDGFKDILMVKQYLSETELDSEQLLQVLKKGKVESVEIMREFIETITVKAKKDKLMSAEMLDKASLRLTLYEAISPKL